MQDGAHARDVLAHLAELTVVGQLLRRVLHAQGELRLEQVQQEHLLQSLYLWLLL